jgi:hypothetical protein
MHRILKSRSMLLLLVASAACDQFGYAIQNQSISPKEIQVIYSPQSRCKSSGSFSLGSHKLFVSRCELSDVERIIVRGPNPQIIDRTELKYRTRLKDGLETVEL